MESVSGNLPSASSWAQSLKSITSQTKQMGVAVSKIYYDRETKELVLFKSHIGAGTSNRYEELDLDTLKNRTFEILSSTSDKEVKYRAVKALFKLMSAKPLDAARLQELTQVSLHAAQGLSPSKALTILNILTNAKRSTPSEQGGTGVHFLAIDAPKKEDPSVQIRYGIYKFVPNPRQVIFANSVLKNLGFIVPKTRMLLHDSPEGKRAIELFQTSCPGRSIHQKSQILVMDRMNAEPFNRIAKEELIANLQNPLIIRNLGRMVIIDLCIGNIDRWNQGRCAPGNMMLARGANPQLVLIDHESRLERMDLDQLKQQILQLLNGDASIRLFDVMSESLHHEWTKLGDTSEKIQIPNLSQLEAFQKGIHEGAKQMIEHFPHREGLEAMTSGELMGPDRVDTNKLWSLIDFLKQMEK